MEKRKHLYVSRKNALTWLMALCLVGSAVARIAIPCLKGSGDSLEVWSQIILPVAATLLYVLIVFISGKEAFYKTAIPVWLLAIYFAIRPHNALLGNPYVLALYCTCLFSYAVLYTAITSGRVRFPWLLAFLFLAPALSLSYVHHWLWQHPEGLTMAPYLYVIADLLLFVGGFFLTFAIRVHSEGEYHRTWGDRSDGRLIRSLPAMSQISPYIMVNRNDATNTFADSFEISHVDRYIRQKRKEGLTSFGITHVLLACYVRAICKYPGINRFLSGQKVYARDDEIQYCMTIKKEMTAESPDTIVKVHLNRHDTAEDVYYKLQKAVEEVKNTPLDSNFDNTAGALTLIPGVVLKFVVHLLKTMDYFGLLPKFLLEVSPFHGSLFFTSMGSLGIPPIYHHLYNFGNLPVFGAFGCKRKAIEVLEDGTLVQRKYVDVKFTLDERIVDGYYYAAFFKHYKRILAHPEVLDNPPEEVLRDID